MYIAKLRPFRCFLANWIDIGCELQTRKDKAFSWYGIILIMTAPDRKGGKMKEQQSFYSK